jgi:hypothetical protein
VNRARRGYPPVLVISAILIAGGVALAVAFRPDKAHERANEDAAQTAIAHFKDKSAGDLALIKVDPDLVRGHRSNFVEGTFSIRNGTDTDIKDVKITCYFIAPSGTALGDAFAMVYQVIPSGSTRKSPAFPSGMLIRKPRDTNAMWLISNTISAKPDDNSMTYPAPAENAGPLARLATGIALAAFSLATGHPEIGLAGPMLNFAIDHFTNRPTRLLMNELRSGGIEALNDEKTKLFVPMTFRFFEAARQGEYEHNLRILGAYLASELNEAVPDPGDFSRMARRIQALSKVDLKVLALIEAYCRNQEALFGREPFITAISLDTFAGEANELNFGLIGESLTDLHGRGFVMLHGSSSIGKMETTYVASGSFYDLMKRAREKVISEAGGES